VRQNILSGPTPWRAAPPMERPIHSPPSKMATMFAGELVIAYPLCKLGSLAALLEGARKASLCAPVAQA